MVVKRTHYLKIHPEMFNAVLIGDKRCEFRKDDRHFAVGDELELRFWDPSDDLATGEPGGYAWKKSAYMSPRQRWVGNVEKDECESITVIVTHVVRGPHFGIPKGFCLMSVEPKQAKNGEES